MIAIARPRVRTRGLPAETIFFSTYGLFAGPINESVVEKPVRLFARRLNALIKAVIFDVDGTFEEPH